MNIFDKFRLTGYTSIITGGERGIGLAIACAFAQAGSDIVIAGIDDTAADSAVQKIQRENVKCHFIKTDVSDENQVQRMVKFAAEQYGQIDVLVNNSGINSQYKAEEMPLSEWNRVLDVNLTGQFIVSKEVGKIMLIRGKGAIINIASMSGMIVNTPQTQCNYNTSKAGVIMLTKSLASEWADKGIRVNAIAPGYMRTPLTEHRFADPNNPSPVVKRWLSMVPMGRVGTPDELTGAALYLASDASSYTTGAVITIDGGYTIW